MPSDLIVILGPTAVGKTRLTSMLADRFDGEIISADSRQVYREMEIGTGKDISDYNVNGKQIKYHLIDIIEPDQEYNLFLFKQDFYRTFDEIKQRDKLPFLAGGTGLYLSSIIQNYKLQKTDFENEFEELDKKSIEELTSILFLRNPKLHNTTDLLQKERIIKAIQISNAGSGKDIPRGNVVNPFIIGIHLDREIIKKRITERLKYRLNNGMIDEVENLLKNGIGFEKLFFFGLEYKFLAQYLKGELSYNDMYQKLNSSIHSFAKRQMTWFRKMEKEGVLINWIEGADFEKASRLISRELNHIEK